MIEMEKLLAQDEVFQQGGTPLASRQTVLIVGDPNALIGGEGRGARVCRIARYVLVGFTAVAGGCFVKLTHN